MNFKDYIEYVKNGASSTYTPEISLIALTEEVGEVAGLIKKKSIYPSYDFVQKYGSTFEYEIEDELGDVLWQYINLCNQYHISIDDIIKHNVEKLNERHGENKVASDGGKR